MSLSALNSLLRSWRQQPVMHITTLSVLVSSFSILTFALLIHQNLNTYLSQWGKDVKVSIYLNNNSTEASLNKIRERVVSSDLFSDVKYVSKSEAVKKFKERFGNYSSEVLSDLEAENPLPQSFEMILKKNFDLNFNFSKIVTLANELKSYFGVDEVSYGQGWVENYASVLSIFSVTSGVIVVVLILGSLFVFGNMVRSTTSQRSDELEILELFGATRWMILWPLVFEGCIMGFISSSMALLVAFAFYKWQTHLYSSDLNFWVLKMHFEYLSSSRILGVLIGGALLGAGCAYFWGLRASSGYSAAEAASR